MTAVVLLSRYAKPECFEMLFTAEIFTVLWLLQTVFLQSFYNGMIIRKTIL